MGRYDLFELIELNAVSVRYPERPPRIAEVLEMQEHFPSESGHSARAVELMLLAKSGRSSS